MVKLTERAHRTRPRREPVASTTATQEEMGSGGPLRAGPQSMLGPVGIAFAVLVVVGLPLLTFTWDGSDSDAEILAWYEDGGNRVRQLIGAIVLAIAGLAFMFFVNQLRDRVTSERTDHLGRVMAMSGAVFTSALFLGSASFAAVSADVEIGDNPVPASIDVIRIAESFGYGSILLFGAVAMALTVFAATRAGQLDGVMPVWLTRFGYGCAALILLSVLFFPFLLIPIWALVVGVWALRSDQSAEPR